jgi:MYXO-CTERM domain-containing protein
MGLRVPVLASLLSIGLAGSAFAGPPGPPGPVIHSPEQTPLISNGNPAENCQWPTTVLLSGGGGLCSGTLVHPQIVTTAAHCGHPSQITFGETAFSSGRQIPVDHCMRNPEWSMSNNNGVNEDDFAYCKLAQPIYDIPFTPPVYGCEIEILHIGRQSFIVGFGNNQGDNGAGTKRWAETVIQTPVNEFSTTVAVGASGTAACSGDSGGPAYVQYPDGSFHAFGTVSGGPACGSGADTYTLIHKAVPWIEENSGVDITPCHDVDGTWNPTPECQGFAIETLDTSVDWDNWCATPRLGASATCGQAFNAEPDDLAPIVAITAPDNGAVFEGPQASFDILIDAQDEGHGVKSVALEVNGEVVATDEHAPWEFANAQFPEGGWILVAVAEDWNGNVGASEPVAIGVGQDPPELPTGEDDGDGDGESGGPTSETGGELGDQGIDGDGGCACAATPADRGAPLAMLLGLLALVGFRRRRERAGA